MTTPPKSIKEKVHELIFEADTPAGKLFDVILLICIFISVTAIALETLPALSKQAKSNLRILEYVMTALFSVEYALRLWCVKKPLTYARSFFGVIDLIAILPAFLIVLFPAAHALTFLRAIRLLRIFRVLHMPAFEAEASTFKDAFMATRAKITVFLLGVTIMVVIVGSAIYYIEYDNELEAAEQAFSSIPHGIYWAIVTLTTVGYGDITPITPIGRILSSLMMLMGYGLIVVPTGLLGAEIVQHKTSTQHCRNCNHSHHIAGAKHCHNCGDKL